MSLKGGGVQRWIQDYFNQLCELQLKTGVTNQRQEKLSLADGFRSYSQYIKQMLSTNSKLMLIGNGGSAGISSHLAIDYSKNGCIPALSFNDASALTCLSNDFGYENVFSKQIEYHGRKGDVLVAISSSGTSENIIKAVLTARAIQCRVVTLSGFNPNNPLRQLGDINFYIDSSQYGLVEVSHLALGHAMLDHIIMENNRIEPRLETALTIG